MLFLFVGYHECAFGHGIEEWLWWAGYRNLEYDHAGYVWRNGSKFLDLFIFGDFIFCLNINTCINLQQEKSQK